MAWRTNEGGRQWRKDASAAKRSEKERRAVVEPLTPGHKRKSIPAIKRKFGIEQKYVGPDYGSHLGFFRRDREWHHYYGGWYEKERDRDNALAALRKNIRPWSKYEYRPVERE